MSAFSRNLCPLALAGLAACAAPLDSREAAIVGGIEVTNGFWPQVAFVDVAMSEMVSSRCTGVLTEAGVVLTAAHCVWGPLHRQAVRALDDSLRGQRFRVDEYRKMRSALVDTIGEVGSGEELPASISLATSDVAGARLERRVVAYAMHPEGFAAVREHLKKAAARILASREQGSSDAVMFHHDFAVLYLDRPVTDVPALPLLIPAQAGNLLYDGAPLTAIGFGAFNPTADRVDGRLRELSVRVSARDCDSSCARRFEVAVRGGDRSTPCHGDSGGPLVAFSERGPVIAGIASRFASSQLNPDVPCDGSAALVYGRSDTVVDWYQRVRFGMPAPSARRDGGGGCGVSGDDAGAGLLFALLAVLFGHRRRLALSRR